ncbi:MAG: DUF1345 domain-containing protein [Ilumatobacteraceae bacterium]
MELAQIRHISARLRVNVCAGLGLAVGLVAAPFVPWQLAVVCGWIALAGSLLLWTWSEIGPCDAQHTERLSTVEDSSRVTAVLVMVTASVMSIGSTAVGLAKSRHVSFPLEVALTVASILGVLLAWGVVHTMFTLRYAHQYYVSPVGGIDFPGSAAPDYRDFAYFAFTIGMSFATSDCEITSRLIRRIALRHALVSYLFGAVIVGLTINVMASFIG